MTVSAIEWNFDQIFPRPNSTSNHFDLRLTTEAGPLLISNGGLNKIIYHFEKKAGFPPMRDDFNSKYFCSHLDSIDYITT